MPSEWQIRKNGVTPTISSSKYGWTGMQKNGVDCHRLAAVGLAVSALLGRPSPTAANRLARAKG